jgi:hypothetical protein
MQPEVDSGFCRIVNFPTSMEVFFVSTPFMIDGFSVERERTRQDVSSGVYNGDPGFGFNRAKYYVSSTPLIEIHSFRFYSL